MIAMKRGGWYNLTTRSSKELPSSQENEEEMIRKRQRRAKEEHGLPPRGLHETVFSGIIQVSVRSRR